MNAKILVNIPTIPSLYPTIAGSFTLHTKKKEKKNSPLSSEGGSLQTSPTSEHVVPILLRLSCLSAYETKDDIMSYLVCSKPLVVYFKSMWWPCFERTDVFFRRFLSLTSVKRRETNPCL